MKKINLYLTLMGIICISSILFNYIIPMPKWTNIFVAIIQFVLIYLIAKSKESN